MWFEFVQQPVGLVKGVEPKQTMREEGADMSAELRQKLEVLKGRLFSLRSHL